MKISKYILIFVFAVFGNSCFAQSFTSKAYECYQSEDYPCAQQWIDSAIVSEERFNSQTWQLRGIIYRKLETPENIKYRDIAIQSFLQARNVDSTGVYKEKIDEYIYKTVVRYYNDAVTYLENNDLESSENSYQVYKNKYAKYVEANYSFDQQDVEYYNALGSEYLKRLSSLMGEERDKASANAIHSFEMVLKIEPNNYQANFNIGIIYYNDGADLVMNMDPLTTPIEILTDNIATSEELFKKALKPLEKAYSVNPQSQEAVEGLAGSYYALNDDENYNKYQKLLDEMRLPGLLESYKKNPRNKEVLNELIRIYTNTIKNEAEAKKYKSELDKLGE